MEALAAFSVIFLAFALLGVVHLIGQILAVVDIVRREDPQVVGDSRLLWVLIVIFVPFGWLVYFIIGRR